MLGVGCHHGFGPASSLDDDRNYVSTICLENGRETGQPDSVELDGLGQCTTSWRCDQKRSSDRAMFDDVIHN